MKKFIITTTIEEEIEAEDENEASQKFFEAVEGEPQQTLATYLSDHLKITEMKEKTYILKRNCPNICKEIGDYYNNEYRESIEELIEKGIIEEEKEGE